MGSSSQKPDAQTLNNAPFAIAAMVAQSGV
jgi:hypothetical protein